MWDKLKQTLGVTPKIIENEKEKTPDEIRRELLQKEKEEAEKNKKPWVAVLDTQVNPDNIRNGFFELDWNDEFIEQLLDAGYKGESQEEIVDAWFKTIIGQMLDEEGLDNTRERGFIKTDKLDDGKAEVS